MARTEDTVSELQRLPRGRHGLTREQVAAQQRARILAAMVDVCAERGYAETRVVDVINVAGVSRKTFYELFDDKQACFLAAFEVALAMLFDVTTSGFEAPGDASWATRVRYGLAAFLRIIAERPAAARFCIVEIQAAGPKALARRDAAIRQFTHFIEAGRSEASSELPGLTSLALVGGVYEFLYSEILHGATAQLPTRLPDLMYWVTQPFLGPEGAAEQRRLARALLKEQSGAE